MSNRPRLSPEVRARVKASIEELIEERFGPRLRALQERAGDLRPGDDWQTPGLVAERDALVAEVDQFEARLQIEAESRAMDGLVGWDAVHEAVRRWDPGVED